MGTSNIQEAFQKLKEKRETGLIPFLTVGYPHRDATLELVPALIEGGAHLVELGVPFSDPLADGPTIQRASYRALEQGITLEDCLTTCQKLRLQGIATPLVLMGYYNPILAYGLEQFARGASQAGVDGLIVADLPPEEASPLLEACARQDVAVVFLLAPTSTAKRVALACRKSQGFIYCVSLAGVTGAREELPLALPELIAGIRQESSLPIAVGFGVSKASHVEVIGRYADAAVVGSALIDALDNAPPTQLAQRAKEFMLQLKSSPSPSYSRESR